MINKLYAKRRVGWLTSGKEMFIFMLVNMHCLVYKSRIPNFQPCIKNSKKYLIRKMLVCSHNINLMVVQFDLQPIYNMNAIVVCMCLCAFYTIKA